MKKNVLTIFILLVINCCMYKAIAQVKGTVVDAGNKSVAGVSIALLQQKDSAVVKLAVVDNKGNFEFTAIAAGYYCITIRSQNFKPYYSKAFAIDKQGSNIVIDTIQLMAAAATLSGVTVNSKKPLIERKADRTVINVDAMISNAGSNALEVLEKAPGVQIDNNDAITLKGKSGVTIYIDDRPTYLSGADLANYLKSLPASSLDKIEIMTNPPAKYDAAGNAGIINIKTKKSKIKGFNGSFNTSFRQGVYGDSRNTLLFNYRNNKVNVFANISYSQGSNFSDLTINRWYIKADGSLASGFTQNSYIRRSYYSLNAKYGADFSLNKKTTFGIAFNNLTRPSTESRKNTGTFFNAKNATDSVILADNKEEEKFKSNSINLNFRHQFDSTGKELSMDADYISYTTTNEQLFKNASYNADNTLKTKDDLIGSLPTQLNIYSFKTDYTYPLNKTTKLEAGAKTSYINTDNIAAYFIAINNIATPDFEKTNHFIYKENINAAYFNFNKEIKRLILQVGLRAENTISKGHQLGNVIKPDSLFKKNYTNLFPTLFVSYKLDSTGNNQINLAYSRRIDRPYYADLNPFISPLDKFTYYAGNPFLKPQFTHHVELAYAYKSSISTTLFYDRIKDAMDETIELSGNTFISRTGNIGKKNVGGFSIDATIKPAKWWTILPYVQYLYQHTQSKIYTETVDTKGGYWNMSALNQFTINKNWSMELFGRYRSRIVDGQFDLGGWGQVNIGAQKKFLKDKASVKINVIDIFKTRINKGDINSLKGGRGNYYNEADSRAFILAFTYRFSKGAKNNQQERKTGAETEQNRVKQ